MRCCLTWLRLDLTSWLVSVSVIAVRESHDFLRMICAQLLTGLAVLAILWVDVSRACLLLRT